VKVLKIIGIITLSPVLLFVCVGIGLSNDIEVRRSRDIKASIDEIHAFVGNLEKWPNWSPWHEVDPSIIITIGAKKQGVGAEQTWTGNNGGGRLVFTQVDTHNGIAYDLWIDDYAMPSKSTIAYEAIDEGTRVTWILNGRESGVVMGGYRAKITMMFCGMGFDVGLEKLDDATHPSSAQSGVVKGDTGSEPSPAKTTLPSTTE
jgi:hypothetical protein